MLTTPNATATDTLDFDAIYSAAERNAERVPWDDGHPSPPLVTWLNAAAPGLVRCGARTAVVGCGLGDDARELRRRGYDVTAFDVSPTAIDWARAIDPAHAECFQVADLFDLAPRLRRRFDLVVEINTVQALDPTRRDAAIGAIADLLAPHGLLLVIARNCASPDDRTTGPPWPFTREELESAAAAAGLAPHGEVSIFLDGEDPPVRRMRGLFHRA